MGVGRESFGPHLETSKEEIGLVLLFQESQSTQVTEQIDFSLKEGQHSEVGEH